MKFCANCGSPLPEAAADTVEDSFENQNSYQTQDAYPNQYQNQYQNPYQEGYQTGQRPVNGFGVAALVLGIVGLFIVFCSILAIIFGAIGISKANKDPRYGKGMAIAGLVLGIIAVVITLILVVIAGALVSSYGFYSLFS
jgi:O-antigen ligase